MSSCPYTWFKGLFSTDSKVSGLASHLRVTVLREQSLTVDVTLPAGSARWLIDFIPDDVVTKIKEEGIPIEDIQEKLAKKLELYPQKIFALEEPNRVVYVWLE